jgi:hypothetical protein
MYTQESSLDFWTAHLKTEFDAMPDRVQRATVEHVQRLLDREQQQHARNIRRDPSPLARMAFRVYGIPVPWLTAAQQSSDPLEQEKIKRVLAALNS